MPLAKWVSLFDCSSVDFEKDKQQRQNQCKFDFHVDENENDTRTDIEKKIDIEYEETGGDIYEYQSTRVLTRNTS